MSYALPKKTADASWVGSEAYARPGSPVDGRWGDGDRGAGIRRLAPKGWLSQRVQAAKLYEGGQYVPPFGGVHAAWAGSGIYTPPERGVRAFWARVVGDDQYLPGVGMGDAGAVGTPAAVYTQIATAAGTAPPGLGTPTTEQIYRLSAAWVGAPPYTPPGMMAYGWWAGIPDGSVFPAGRRQSACGVARILNAAEELRVEGIPGRVFFGAAEAWNYHTYVSLQARGISSQLFGAAYMQGGVKYVAPGAVTAPVPPAPVVVNTKADQTAAPAGVAWPGMGAVNVSPRLLRPHGIYGTAAGSPRVQFPPQPGGWLSSASGYPVVEFRTRVVQPAGVYSFGEGFPRAADRARKVFHGASPVSAVFGDVRVRAKNFRVQVSGLPPLEIAPWTEARNTRRYLGALGALSQAFGAEATAHNKTPSIAPAGLDTQQFGRADHTVVGWRVRSVVAPGAPVPFPQFGAVSLWQPPSLAPAGIAAKAVPAPTVGPAIRRVLVDGRDMQRFEGATVWFSYRFVVAKDQGIAGASYGTARAEHGRRGIAILGAPFMAFGTTWVSRGLRVLGPQGISAPLLSRHQVGGTRFLGPEGFYATRWLARITPEDREVFPKTFGAEYGLAKVGNKQRPVYPAGIRTYSEEAQRWGTARLWGLRQIVTMYEDQESGLWPMPWPQWTAVENRNKVMQAAGFNAERFPGALVENGARLVVPAGVAYPTLPEYQKTGAVTHCVRPLLLDGVDAPMLSRWAVVHNAARLILPRGLDAILAGLPEAINLRRAYRLQGLYSTEPGHPFVADRIRALSFESRYGIQPPRIELPAVHLHTRYVESSSIDTPGVGSAALTVFFRRATPRWTHRDLFGDPALKNMTPELLTRGRVHEDFGVQRVRLQWRPVNTDGANTQLFGVARISDRKRHLSVAGMNLMLVSDKVTVHRVGEDPVVTQYVDLRRTVVGPDNAPVEQGEGGGIPYPWPAMGTPDLLKGYIFHGLGGYNDMLGMGRPVVTANSIRVEPGIFDFYVGGPAVSLRTRKLSAPTLGQLVVDSTENRDSMGSWGKPRLSPHTIYAVLEATYQAMRNHAMNPSSPRPVHTSVTFGEARLSLWNGSIRPVSIGPTSPVNAWGVGRPSLTNKRQYVTPYGTLMQRLGWPVVPGPRNILIEEPIAGGAAGNPGVARPPYTGPSIVRAGGLSFQSVGAHVVGLRTRVVRPSGWFSQAFSTTYGDGKNSLYMPQTLTVGPKMPVTPVGAEAGLYGEPWVSLQIRGLQVEGHDSFLSEYDYQEFDKRMRVRNLTDPWAGRSVLTTKGHMSSRVGAPGLRGGTHYIRPDGNSDQHRKGVIQ